MEKEKGHSKEHRDSNTKTIVVGGEKKLLLMDEDEPIDVGETISESELRELIEAIVGSILESEQT